MCLSERENFLLCALISLFSQCVHACRSHSTGGLSRIWNTSCSQSRLQEPRGRHRLSTVIQPLRQSAGEVVDLTVDEDGKSTLYTNLYISSASLFFFFPTHFFKQPFSTHVQMISKTFS